MNLCYLYFENITYTSVKEFAKNFEEVEYVDIATAKSVGDFNAYVVDIAEFDQEKTKKLHTLLKSKEEKLIYLFSYGATNRFFYQFAYILHVDAILSVKQSVEKNIQTITTAYTNEIQRKKYAYIGKFASEKLLYMVFKSQNLLFASETLMSAFRCRSLEDVKTNVCQKLPLEKLLAHSSTTAVCEQFFDEENIECVKSFYNNGEYLVFIERYNYKELFKTNAKELTTRLYFVDYLKETLEHGFGGEYAIMTVKIANFKKIGNLIGKTDLESFSAKFIYKTKEILAEYEIFSEYSQDFFVLMYNNQSFEALEQKAQEFYAQMQSFIEEYNFKIDLAIYVIEVGSLDYLATLTLLDSIKNGKISKKDIKDKKVKYIGRYSDDMSDREIISLLFDDSYINDVELTLVNVYKGMVIDSATKIIKKEQNAIYVTLSHIQGAVMNLEKRTIIKSSIIDKDIRAKVAFIDTKRKIAKLENFKVVENDSLYKDKDRVNFAKKNIAILSLTGTRVFAEILDISSKAISLKLNKMKMLEKYMNKTVEITFSIPTTRTREREIKITEEVNISYIDCTAEDTCKIIAIFDETSKNRNIIKEYVKTRQSEILKELQKLNY